MARPRTRPPTCIVPARIPVAQRRLLDLHVLHLGKSRNEVLGAWIERGLREAGLLPSSSA